MLSDVDGCVGVTGCRLFSVPHRLDAIVGLNYPCDAICIARTYVVLATPRHDACGILALRVLPLERRICLGVTRCGKN